MNISIQSTPLQGDLYTSFHSARPFPLIVLDNFFPNHIVEQLTEEIARTPETQKSNDYIFAKNKYETPQFEHLGPYAQAVKTFLLGKDFATAISSMVGRPLFVDPDFVGGGIHRGGKKSFLDMHTDFNLHPRNRHWIRELNILLYLNKAWLPEYGGALELRHGTSGETRSIEPLVNRMVIMLTKDFTFHGYRQTHFPPNTFRTSVAAYAYSVAKSDAEVENLRTTTTWAPDSGPLKAVIARWTPRVVTLKQRLFGSKTAKRK